MHNVEEKSQRKQNNKPSKLFDFLNEYLDISFESNGQYHCVHVLKAASFVGAVYHISHYQSTLALLWAKYCGMICSELFSRTREATL